MAKQLLTRLNIYAAIGFSLPQLLPVFSAGQRPLLGRGTKALNNRRVRHGPCGWKQPLKIDDFEVSEQYLGHW